MCAGWGGATRGTLIVQDRRTRPIRSGVGHRFRASTKSTTLFQIWQPQATKSWRFEGRREVGKRTPRRFSIASAFLPSFSARSRFCGSAVASSGAKSSFFFVLWGGAPGQGRAAQGQGKGKGRGVVGRGCEVCEGRNGSGEAEVLWVATAVGDRDQARARRLLTC